MGPAMPTKICCRFAAKFQSLPFRLVGAQWQLHLQTRSRRIRTIQRRDAQGGMSCRMACHILVEHLLHGTFWYINWNFGISMAHLWGVPCADGGLHHVQKERSSEATTWLSHDVRRLHRLPGLPFFKPWSKGHPVGILWRTFDILTFEPCNPTMTHFISYLCDDLMECLSLLILDAKFFTLYILWNLLLLKWSLGRSNDISNGQERLARLLSGPLLCEMSWSVVRRSQLPGLQAQGGTFQRLGMVLPQAAGSDHSEIVMRHGLFFDVCYPLVMTNIAMENGYL